ncbi:hypothetical protein [Pelagibacterium xiamenense]|uniref:hypothetical protein n=1 Tax=Pelagibacterium xiamenense TaxID=2901140 RepID=UPI001E2B6375|nr:hypothetical protein [Pelagibacterium xiamenense]MCD7059999.1 hypothetical protein [Pelagibacterium xiamenense]
MTARAYRTGLRIGAALALSVFATGTSSVAARAQNVVDQTERSQDVAVSSSPRGPFGAFAELSYSSVRQDDSVAHPANTGTGGVRLGLMVAVPDANAVVLPSLTVERSSGTGSNPFATTEATGTVLGGDLSAAIALTPHVRMYLGAGAAAGTQEVVFNDADTSLTDIRRISARAGFGVDIYKGDEATVAISNMLEFARLHADYAPQNSVDASQATSLANSLKITGTWDVTDATTLNASASFVHLFVAEPLAGENPLDENYGVISVGASHELSPQFSIYGNAGVVVGGIRQGSVTARLGIATYF